MLKLDNGEASKVASRVSPELFETPKNKFAYECLRGAAIKGQSFGPETSIAFLSQQPGRLDHYGGADNAVQVHVEDCVLAADSADSWPQYAEQLCLAHTRRTLMSVLDKSALEAGTATTADDAMMLAVSSVIEAAGKLKPLVSDESYCIESLSDDFMTRYMTGDNAIPFPQDQLNTIGGCRPGNVVILSSYTGIGKSWTALDWAMHFMSFGKRVSYYTMEMTQDELLERLVSMEFNLPLERVISRSYPSEVIRAHLDAISKYPLDIRDGSCSINRVISDVIAAGVDKPDVVVLDHAHLMDLIGSDYRISLNSMLQQLKTFAVSQRIIIILLAQLSRPDDRREVPRPTIYMLKESGSFEQIADFIIFIHKKVEHTFGLRSESHIMYCDKQRQGKPYGDFEVRFERYKFR